MSDFNNIISRECLKCSSLSAFQCCNPLMQDHKAAEAFGRQH